MKLFIGSGAATLALALLMGAAAPAKPAERDKPRWVPLSNNSVTGAELAVNVDDSTFMTIDGKNDVRFALPTRVVNNTTGRVMLFLLAFRLSDCDRGYGTATVLDMDRRVTGAGEWALSGGTGYSTVADFVCGAYQQVRKKSDASGKL